MTYENLPGRPFQMGFVVPDMDKGIEYMQKMLGTGRFMALPADPKAAWFRGEMEEMAYKIAFGYMGDMLIELIQPVSGRSTYSEFLERVPEGGLHHMGFQVEDFEAAVADVEARGYCPVQKGSFGGTHFSYYESDTDPGVIIEILYLDEAVQSMFASIKDQSF